MYCISQYMFLYNILTTKFRWVRLSPFSLSSKPCTRFRRLWCRDTLGGRKRCRGWVSTEMHLNKLSSALRTITAKIMKYTRKHQTLYTIKKEIHIAKSYKIINIFIILLKFLYYILYYWFCWMWKLGLFQLHDLNWRYIWWMMWGWRCEEWW